MKDVPTVLREAAAHVRAGWCQGTMHRVDNYQGLHNRVLGLRTQDRYCALGAIAATEREHCAEAWGALAMAIGTYNITGWNDAWGQTAENVAAGLEYAALVYEQAHAQQAAQPQPEGVRA